MKVFALVILSTLTVLTVSGLSSALPEITQAFSLYSSNELWARIFLTMPALSLALTAALIGTFSDRFGRRKVLLTATGVYAVAGSAALYLDSLPALLLSRVLLGICTGAISAISTALIADHYSGVHRQRVLGYQAGMLAASGAVFVILAGMLADMHWRYPFFLYLLAIPCLLVTALSVRHVENSDKSALLKTDDRQVLQRLWFLYGTAFLSLLLFFIVFIELPFYLVHDFALNNTQTGFVIAVLTGFSVAPALLFSTFSRRLSLQRLLMLLLLLMAIGACLLAIATHLAVVVIGLLVFAAGSGMLLPNFNAQLALLVPVHQRARYFGGLVTVIFIAQFISPLASQGILFWSELRSLFLVLAGVAVAIILWIGYSGQGWEPSADSASQ